MMRDADYQRLGRDPDFIRLPARRGHAAFGLFLTIMVMFAALLLTVAFAPQPLANTVASARIMAIAGIAVIIQPWLLTLFYSRGANRNSVKMSAVMGTVLGK